MKLLISAPTGYNARELLLPLHEHLASDADIPEIHVITPAAPYAAALFPAFAKKFFWHNNPADLAGHTELLKTVKPTVILTPTVGLDAKDIYILRAGKELGISTVTFIASWDNVFKMERLKKKGFSGAEKGRTLDYQFPDFIAVWNQMNYDHVLEAFGDEIEASHMTITGPPRFDYFAHADRIPSRDDLLAYIGFAPADSAKPLLHCATTELYPFEYIIKALHQAAQAHKLPDSLLYASVHPGGDMKRHRQYAQYGAHVKYSFGRRQHAPVAEFAYLPSEKEIYMLIALWRHTNVLINQSSTVAIESMAADAPIINVKYGQPWDWVGWRRSMVYRDFTQHYRYITDGGGTRIVTTAGQLVPEVNRYLDNPALERAERQATLKKMITYTDGTSSQRLLAYLKQCAA
jgi:hypothetical protein